MALILLSGSFKEFYNGKKIWFRNEGGLYLSVFADDCRREFVKFEQLQMEVWKCLKELSSRFPTDQKQSRFGR